MFMFLFLFFSVLLLCSFFRLKELFQVKNGVTMSLLFLKKCQKFGSVGRRRKKRGWPNLVLCLTKFVDTLLQPISKSQKSYLSLKNRTFLVSMDVMSLDTNIQQNEGILKLSVTTHMKISTKITHSYTLLAGNS